VEAGTIGTAVVAAGDCNVEEAAADTAVGAWITTGWNMATGGIIAGQTG
jgi:hypothetical protein